MMHLGDTKKDSLLSDATDTLIHKETVAPSVVDISELVWTSTVTEVNATTEAEPSYYYCAKVKFVTFH